MLKNMSIRKRILTILGIVYVLSLAAVVSIGYYLLEQDTLREAKEKTEIFAETMSANQQYMSKFVRPDIMDMLPDEYFPEASVGILMLAESAKIIQQNYPEYIFKVASPNPLNPDNYSDPFEQRIISGFDRGDYDDWEGFTTKGGKSFYATAVPIVASQSCIWCHDTPQTAHPDMVEDYGTASGYGYEEGDVVGGRFIYVPTEKAKELTLQKLGGLATVISVLFLIALLIIDRIIIRSIVLPIERIVEVAGDISRGKMDRNFDVDTNDEIKQLADAFNRMKISLEKAMDILKR